MDYDKPAEDSNSDSNYEAKNSIKDNDSNDGSVPKLTATSGSMLYEDSGVGVCNQGKEESAQAEQPAHEEESESEDEHIHNIARSIDQRMQATKTCEEQDSSRAAAANNEGPSLWLY